MATDEAPGSDLRPDGLIILPLPPPALVAAGTAALCALVAAGVSLAVGSWLTFMNAFGVLAAVPLVAIMLGLGWSRRGRAARPAADQNERAAFAAMLGAVSAMAWFPAVIVVDVLRAALLSEAISLATVAGVGPAVVVASYRWVRLRRDRRRGR